MWKQIKRKFKDKKGLGSIEIVISSLIVIMVIAGLIDMINIIQRLETTSQATGYVSRIVQKQGGVQPNRVKNYEGKYTNTKTLYDNVKEMMDANSIDEEDWKLSVVTNDTKYVLKPSTKVPLINYGSRIGITLEVNYKWDVLSSMFPTEFKSSRTSNRQVLSGYQVRESSELNSDFEVN